MKSSSTKFDLTALGVATKLIDGAAIGGPCCSNLASRLRSPSRDSRSECSKADKRSSTSSFAFEIPAHNTSNPISITVRGLSTCFASLMMDCNCLIY